MPDASKPPDADLAFASMFALLTALVIDVIATVGAVRDHVQLKHLAENFGTELPSITVLAHHIPPSGIVAVAILAGIGLAVKEVFIRRRLDSCVTNILAIALISAGYWCYHHALLSPIMFTIHSLS